MARITTQMAETSGLDRKLTLADFQDLKDFARGSGCDVVYSETLHNAEGRGYVAHALLKTGVH